MLLSCFGRCIYLSFLAVSTGDLRFRQGVLCGGFYQDGPVLGMEFLGNICANNYTALQGKIITVVGCVLEVVFLIVVFLVTFAVGMGWPPCSSGF